MAIVAARILANLSPERVRQIFSLLRRGSRPASLQYAAGARRTIEAVSLRCAGTKGCLPRSLAITLLCRLGGRWPTWCLGVRRLPPFGAHAWVEADGEPVGEEHPADYFRTFYTV
jgi:hypothetical protein